MVSKRSLLTLSIVVLLAGASIAVAGSTGIGHHESLPGASLQQDAPGDTQPSNETIEERALSNNTTVESLTGTLRLTIDTGETTNTTKAKIWVEPPNNVRLKYISGPQEGTLIVSNQSTLWVYQPETNTALYYQSSEMRRGIVQQLQQTFQNLSGEFTAEYKGQATVSGQETYVVSVQPTNESGPFAQLLKNQTVWLDQDTWFPIKQKVTATAGNETLTTTATYTTINDNASIPSERFTFEPPENATVRTIDFPTPTSVDSIQAAQRMVNFSIHEPQVSEKYDVRNASIISTDNGTTVTITYQSEAGTLVFTQSTAERSAAGEMNVSIGDFTGRYQTIAEQHVLQWNDTQFSYSLTGSLSKPTLIRIAESIYC